VAADDRGHGAGDVLRTLLVAGGFAFAVVLVVIFIYPELGLLSSLLIMAAVTLMLVRAYSLGHRYRCARCGDVFRVPLLVDLLTMGGIGKNPDGTYHNWKSLTCPRCGRRSRAVVVKHFGDEVGDADAYADAEGGRRRRPRSRQRRGGRQR